MASREAWILATLGARGSVQVAEFARELSVSEVTIRKDLDALARRQLLRRTRGGAVASDRGGEGAFADRLQRAAAAKQAIAAAAAELVSDGDVVALDTSSTAHHLALELVRRHGLVVITSSLPTATVLMERSDARIIMPGGTVRRESSGLVGPVSGRWSRAAGSTRRSSGWQGLRRSEGCSSSPPTRRCRRPRSSPRATRCTGSSTPARSTGSRCTRSRHPSR